MANKTSGKKHNVAYKHQFAFTSNLIDTNTTKYFSPHWNIFKYLFSSKQRR